jgi:respiratory burst oxidase
LCCFFKEHCPPTCQPGQASQTLQTSLSLSLSPFYLIIDRMRLSASSSSSFGRHSSRRSNYSRSFELPDDLDDTGGGPMLPIFLNSLSQSNPQDLVEVTLELEEDSVVVCSVTPTRDEPRLERNLSVTSRIRRKFPWLRSTSNASDISMEEEMQVEESTVMSARDARRIGARLQRTRSSAQQALKGLRFISKSTSTRACDAEESWRTVEARFHSVSKDGLVAREDFGECIGIVYIMRYSLIWLKL